MGLRISTNQGALSALRNLRQTSLQQLRNFERLSTGFRINRGSDDPSGLVLLEQMRGELQAIQQATENTQRARGLVNTADAALGQVSHQLSKLKANLVAAQNTGTLGPDAQNALQTSINQTLSAIDRIGGTTRFGGQNLLNGNLSFHVTNASSELTNIDLQGGSFPNGFPVNVDIDVTATAKRAEAAGTLAATQTSDVEFSITGPGGSATLNIAAGTSQADVIAAINAETATTGVEATAAGKIRTVNVGSNQSLNLQELTGDLEGITPGFSEGADIIAQVDGADVSGTGNTINTSGAFDAEITLKEGATGSFQFTVQGGGAYFQLGPTTGGGNDISIGINNVSSNSLGISSGVGTLKDLLTGGPGSVGVNPGQGADIVDAAIREISAQRSRLGSVSRQVFDVNESALGVAFENLSAAGSRLGDADFAKELADSVRLRLLRESGIAVLRQVNLNQGAALRLLG